MSLDAHLWQEVDSMVSMVVTQCDVLGNKVITKPEMIKALVSENAMRESLH